MKRTISEQLVDGAFNLEAEGVEGCSEKYAPLAFRFMAPVATVFACWVLRRAKEQGIQRLYFLSRDCQLIWKAAQVLSPEFGDMDCRYLQMSKSILFPSSSDISEEGMPWLFEEKTTHVLKELLARIELQYEDFAPFFSRSAAEGDLYVLQTEKDRAAFWEALHQPVLHEKLTRLVQKRRDATRRYFETQGLFEDIKWAMVDVGWALRCQRALRTLMTQWGWGGDVFGYYLGAMEGATSALSTESFEALFRWGEGEGFKNKTRPEVFKNMIMMENLLGTADHPTVHHYGLDENGVGVPVYNQIVSGETTERFLAFDCAIHAWASRVVGFATDVGEETVASGRIDRMIQSFFRNADAALVRPLMDVSFSLSRDDLKQYPLVRPLTWREAMEPIFLSWSFLNRFQKKSYVLWRKGSLVVSSWWVRNLYVFSCRVCSVRKKYDRIRHV